MINIAVFDAKKYDIKSINSLNDKDIKFSFFENRLTIDTIKLAHGFDGVCVFVNDNVNKRPEDLHCTEYPMSCTWNIPS